MFSFVEQIHIIVSEAQEVTGQEQIDGGEALCRQ